MSNDPTFRTERRAKLDGGLDSRSGPFGQPDRITSVQNLHYIESGSLVKRKGGSPQAQMDAMTAATDLPAPTAAETGIGTFANGNYYFAYTIATKVTTGVIGCSAESAVLTVTGGGTAGVTISIKPLNSGEAVGQGTDGVDWLANCGYNFTVGVGGSGIEVYARTGADALTKQTISAAGITWDTTTRTWQIHINAYTNNGAANPNTVKPVSGRSIVYVPDIPALIAWFGDRCRVLACGTYSYALGFTGIIPMATDKDGNLFGFSRFPSPIYTAIIDKLLVASDGIGKPKKLNWTGSSSTTKWYMLGANAPASAPTTAIGSATGITGSYTYKISYVFQTTRCDGTTYNVESNPSSASTPAITPANQKVNVTIPTTTESGIQYYNVYRTTNGGTVYYLQAKVAASGFSNPHVDSTADGSLTLTQQPVTDYELSHGTPPARLWFLQEFAGRLWGVECNWGYNTSSYQIFQINPTSTVRWTLAGDPDCWPSTLSAACGAGMITALYAHRGVLFVFKADEIGVIEGSGVTNTDFAYRTLYRGIGAMMHSVMTFHGDLYFWDQAKGPMRLSGYSVEPIGTDDVQEAWRAETYCGIRCVAADTVNNELRWQVTRYHYEYTDYTLTPSTHKEYVCYFRADGGVAWSIYQGGTTASRYDRQIVGVANAPVNLNTSGAADPYQLRYGTYWVDTYGRWVLDDQVEYDSDPNVSATHIDITYFANLVWMFADNPEMLKIFRHLYLMVRMGSSASDGIVVYGAYISAFDNGTPAYVIIKTIAATVALANKWRMIRCDIQQALQGSLSQERGLLVRLYGTAQAGPVKIAMVSCKYKNLNDTRNAP